MPEIDIRPFKTSSNADILNAIRHTSSPAYQSRVPEATQANIQDTLQNLTDYRPLWNEFVEALVNRIGLVIVRNSIWTNPLAKFKRGMLSFGDTIEEVNVGLIKSRVYNSDRLNLERDIFGNYPADVQSSFHRINRQEYYAITINEPLLQRAFLETDGLSKFITDLMSAPTTSDNWDEFLITTGLFEEYYKAGGFFKIQVPEVDVEGSDAADAKFFLRRVREMAGTLQFLSTHYNASGMPVAVNPEDLELFVTPEALAAIDVEALAGAFNIDKSDMPGRINIIPKEHFRIPGVQAILTTRDFFVIADARIETASVWNPVSLSNNFFLHHWEVISASRFVPAILFTTEEGTDIEMIDTPVTGVSTITVVDEEGDNVTAVERGVLYQVIGNAITSPTGGVNDAIRLELDGAQSSKTVLRQTGVLIISSEEAATSITIRAFAVDSDDPQETASVTVNVVGDKLTLWPDSHVSSDTDEDGLFETAVPAAPVFVDLGSTGTVTIPEYDIDVDHYKYRKGGVDIASGTVDNISGSTTYTVVAASGYELPVGATASWTFNPA